MSGLTEAQIEVLLRPIKPSRVAKRDGQSNVEAYDVRAHLTRMFGFCNWDEVAAEPTTLLYEQETTTKNGKPAYKVAYRATRRLVIRSQDGEHLCTYEGGAVGEAVMPDYLRGDAHDFALKKAESQALKRAAINLGDGFGLSLYRKGSIDPVVVSVVGFSAGASRAPDLAEPDVTEEQHDVYVAADESPLSVPTEPEIDWESEAPPASDDHPSDAGAPMISDQQVKQMQTLFGKLGIKERDAKLKYLSDQVGEAVGSSKDLTMKEAARVIGVLRAEADAR